MDTRFSIALAPVAAGIVALALTGCATRSYVGEQVDSASRATNARVGEVQQQVESAQTDIAGLKQSDQTQNKQLSELSTTAREALDRATAAGKLAEGRFLYEVQLTDESVHFPFGSASLSAEATAALDALAGRLKDENRDVYVEIQGHTDSSGPDEYNLVLGEERAEAVRRYLSVQHGVPLHRINVISYGESRPLADNTNREGRAQNRRVSIVVLT